MKLLDELNVLRNSGDAAVQLLQGDLSELPPEHASDILAMSAFPNNYIALKGSLIYQLNEKGLSVGALALDKAVDLRRQLNCWLSKPLSLADQKKFNVKQILCFEPGEKIKEPEEVVGDIFRCINTFAFNDEHNVIVMPIIATGYQQVPIEKILPALLAAAFFWLKNGLPLTCIKLVVHSDEQAAKAISLFKAFTKKMYSTGAAESGAVADRKSHVPSAPPMIDIPAPSPIINEETAGAVAAPVVPEVKKGYNYFLSYAHVHAKEIQLFVDELNVENKTLSVFYDKDSIPSGGLWIQQISSAIQQAEKVLVFLSPDYDRSPVCWDEFQCAKLMEYNRKKSVIQTIYLYGYKETEMPPIMGIYSYIDCREGNAEKLRDCVKRLLK